MTTQALRLTKTAVEALPFPGTGRVDYRDTELSVLYMRVGARSKTYALRAWDPKVQKPVRRNLGKHPFMTPESARREAMKIMSSGKSIARTVAEGQVETVAQLAEEFLSKHCRPNLTATPLKNYIWCIEKHIIPRFGKMKVRELTRADVRGYYEDYQAKAPQQANKLLTVFSSMMGFALKRDLIEYNPVSNIDKTPTTKRKRVLSDAELRTVCSQFDDKSPLLRHAYWLLMLLGQRRTETIWAEWKEFDFEAKLWVIPGERTKNGLAQSVPLPPLALYHWRALQEVTGDSPYCFWNGKKTHNRKPGPMKPSTVTQDLYRMRTKKKSPLAGIERFTPHDFRRTAATNISALTEDREAVKRVLNHVDTGSATTHYDLHSYDSKKRKALSLWEERLSAVLQNKSVPKLDLDAHVIDLDDDDDD